jgi:hypothetical protein
MQFIILNNHHGAGIRVRLGPLLCVSFLLVLLFIAAVVFAGGMHFAQSQHERSWDTSHNVTGLVWQHELQQQRDTLEDAKAHASQQLNVLAARLSQLHGPCDASGCAGRQTGCHGRAGRFRIQAWTILPGMGGPAGDLQNDTSVHDFLETLDRMTLELDARA